MMTNDEKRQHNLQLPISRIPTEILARIFCILRNSCCATGTDGCVPQGDLCGPSFCLTSWISITYVCHTWREVALDTSLLWCHIDPPNFPDRCQWIPELLRRSKQSLLSVLMARNGVPKEMREHFGRVCELVLYYPLVNILEEHIFTSQTSFPRLEMLRIVSPTGRPFVLNDSHLGAETLRRLFLQDCGIDWNSKFLLGLTHLELWQIPTGSSLGCDDFIRVLSKIPALKTLNLLTFLRNKEEVRTYQAAKVHLQHLQQLSVDCFVPEMAQFLSCLHIPRSCKVVIDIMDECYSVCDDLRSILSWVWNQLQVPTTPSDPSDHIRSLHVLHKPQMGVFEVQGFCDILLHEQLETAVPILQFSVDWGYGIDFDTNLETFFSLLPLGGVTFLDVVIGEDSVYLSPNGWRVAFGSIPTLKTIYLNEDESTFWEALILKPVSSGNTKSDLGFLGLASVTVQDRFLDFELIHDMLRMRSELGGTQLQDLCFSSAGLPPAPWMTKLGELVSHIQVLESDASETPDTDDAYTEDGDSD